MDGTQNAQNGDQKDGDDEFDQFPRPRRGPGDRTPLSPDGEAAEARRQWGRHLKLLRVAQGWSQVELARRSGVSRSTLRALEKGEGTPNGDTRRKLEAVFGREVWEVTSAIAAQEPDDYLRPAWVTRRPVYGPAFCGDPTSEQDQQSQAERWEYPPQYTEPDVGPRGFGVRVEGESMLGYRRAPIPPGAICWVNPERGYGPGTLVCAQVWRAGACSMAIKLLLRENGTTTDVLYSVPHEEQRERYDCDQYSVVGRVVAVDAKIRL